MKNNLDMKIQVSSGVLRSLCNLHLLALIAELDHELHDRHTEAPPLTVDMNITTTSQAAQGVKYFSAIDKSFEL